MGGFGPPSLPYPMEIEMTKQLAKIVNTETGKVFEGSHLSNANLIAHAENNKDTFDLVYMNIKEDIIPTFTQKVQIWPICSETIK